MTQPEEMKEAAVANTEIADGELDNVSGGELNIPPVDGESMDPPHQRTE